MAFTKIQQDVPDGLDGLEWLDGLERPSIAGPGGSSEDDGL